MERKRSAAAALARATRSDRLLRAGPSVTSRIVLANPASRSLCSTPVASCRLKSYSPKPRALIAPGTCAVCPTSTTTRKAARSQADGGGVFAVPAAPSADAQFQAPKTSSSARARNGPRPKCRRSLMECTLSPSRRATPQRATIRPSGPLIRLRQPENLLCDEIEDHVRRNRGDPRNQGLAQVALDVKLPGIAHAAVGEDGGLAGLECGLRRQILGGIGLGGAVRVAVVEARRLHHH